MLKETTVTLYRKKDVLDEFPNLLIQGSFIHPYYQIKLTAPLLKDDLQCYLPNQWRTPERNSDYIGPPTRKERSTGYDS
jgi:hypothetical protein